MQLSFKVELEFSEERIHQIIDGIMANFPEASAGSVLKCRNYNYDKCIFVFEDSETQKTYTLNKEKLTEALKSMLTTDKWRKMKGLTQPPVSTNAEAWDEWLCQADAIDDDAFVQLACLGEVIYG
jgi:hypothetical protein